MIAKKKRTIAFSFNGKNYTVRGYPDEIKHIVLPGEHCCVVIEITGWQNETHPVSFRKAVTIYNTPAEKIASDYDALIAKEVPKKTETKKDIYFSHRNKTYSITVDIDGPSSTISVLPNGLIVKIDWREEHASTIVTVRSIGTIAPIYVAAEESDVVIKFIRAKEERKNSSKNTSFLKNT